MRCHCEGKKRDVFVLSASWAAVIPRRTSCYRMNSARYSREVDTIALGRYTNRRKVGVSKCLPALRQRPKPWPRFLLACATASSVVTPESRSLLDFCTSRRMPCSPSPYLPMLLYERDSPPKARSKSSAFILSMSSAPHSTCRVTLATACSATKPSTSS